MEFIKASTSQCYKCQKPSDKALLVEFTFKDNYLICENCVIDALILINPSKIAVNKDKIDDIIKYLQNGVCNSWQIEQMLEDLKK